MIIVDLETTGLLTGSPDPAGQPGIVQIAWVEIDECWEEIDSNDLLINPEKGIDPDAFATHRIGEDRIRDAPTLAAVLPTLAPVFRRHDTWVGFNNPFDRNVLWYQLLRYTWGQRFPWPSKDIDIMRIARDITNIAGKRDIKHPNLIELHVALFGDRFDDAHDALADCRATHRCGKRLWEQGYI